MEWALVGISRSWDVEGIVGVVKRGGAGGTGLGIGVDIVEGEVAGVDGGDWTECDGVGDVVGMGTGKETSVFGEDDDEGKEVSGWTEEKEGDRGVIQCDRIEAWSCYIKENCGEKVANGNEESSNTMWRKT